MKKRSLFIIKIFVIVIVASVLVWLLFYGGCMGPSRIKWHQSGIYKLSILDLTTVLTGTLAMIMMIEGLIGLVEEVLPKKRSKLASVCLLI